MKADLDLIYNKDEEINFLSKDLYIPMYESILKVFAPVASIADLGCRVGHLISIFKERNNIDVLGVDYFSWNKENASDNIKDNFIVHDLRDVLNINKKYHIIVSTEVGEHIDSMYSNVYLENIKNLMYSNSKLIISWAPGEKSKQHLNPLEKEEFENLMISNGFSKNANETNELAYWCGQYNVFYWYLTSNLSVWEIN